MQMRGHNVDKKTTLESSKQKAIECIIKYNQLCMGQTYAEMAEAYKVRPTLIIQL